MAKISRGDLILLIARLSTIRTGYKATKGQIQRMSIGIYLKPSVEANFPFILSNEFLLSVGIEKAKSSLPYVVISTECGMDTRRLDNYIEDIFVTDDNEIYIGIDPPFEIGKFVEEIMSHYHNRRQGGLVEESYTIMKSERHEAKFRLLLSKIEIIPSE